MKPRIAIALLAVVVSACAVAPSSLVRLSLPPRSASPSLVLATYLEALSVGDCATARTLATVSFASGEGIWCGPGRPRVLAYENPGNPAQPNATEADFAVAVTTEGQPISFYDGPYGWFFIVRAQPDGSWRVDGAGTGP